mgnify:CR=1 FL=1
MQQPVPGRIALKFVIPLETGCFAVANKIFELYPICQSALFASPQGVFREGFHGQIDVLI